MFVAPRKSAAVAPKSDRLMAELGRVEARLQQWIGQSNENAQLFRRDPISAMRSAGLDLEDELICELERLMSGIASRLK